MRQSRLFVMLLCCLAWLLPVLHAESVKTIGPPANYVNDLAGVLNSDTQSDLNALLKSVNDQAKARVLVVTIHKIDDDEPVEQFANELFAKWNPGKKDRGVLMVFSIEDHKRWIEIGYGLEGILPDGKTGDIGRDMVPDLQAANYDGAVRTGVNEISDVIAKDAGVTLDTQPRHTYHREGSGSGGGGFGLFGVLFIVFIVIMLFRGGRGGRGGGGFGGGGGFLSGLLLGNLLGGGRSWGGGGGGGWSGGDGGGSDGGGGWGGGDSGGFDGGGGDGGSSGGGGAGGGW
ncbi:TPM domain-containing protein [Terriglobus sp.]|uniref:TPM domain-containing protein n=1 Tax=Terriglobus sp. TaxID=1889013 RepID=UPI003AFFDBAB